MSSHVGQWHRPHYYLVVWYTNSGSTKIEPWFTQTGQVGKLTSSCSNSRVVCLLETFPNDNGGLVAMESFLVSSSGVGSLCSAVFGGKNILSCDNSRNLQRSSSSSSNSTSRRRRSGSSSSSSSSFSPRCYSESSDLPSSIGELYFLFP